MRRSELTLRARRLCQEPWRVEMAGPERNILEMKKTLEMENRINGERRREGS